MSFNDLNNCPICQRSGGPYKINDKDIYWIDCAVCGKFKISRNVVIYGAYKKIIAENKHILSGMTRRKSEDGSGQVIELAEGNLEDIIRSVTPPSNPLEYYDVILDYLISNTTDYHEFVPFKLETDYSLVYAKDSKTFNFLHGKMAELGWIDDQWLNSKEGIYGLRLTTEGWKEAIERQKSKVKSNQVFVAMAFTDEDGKGKKELDDLYDDYIEPAIKEVGFEAIRIDRQDYLGDVVDKILVSIKESRFIIAEMKYNKTGVYYEAGYALGLGIPIIWCCPNKDEHKNALHFDIEHNNCIMWDNPEDLRNRLVSRIKFLLDESVKR